MKVPLATTLAALICSPLVAPRPAAADPGGGHWRQGDDAPPGWSRGHARWKQERRALAEREDDEDDDERAAQEAYDRGYRDGVERGEQAEEPPPAPEPAPEEFDRSLNPYGDWIDTPEYGRVWRPYQTAADWQPYRAGRWVLTGYGWTWVSDEPYGWAVYHYGRWTWVAGGWAWVPGRVWAPAWVSWRWGGGVAAWCPLGPAGVVFVEPARWVVVEQTVFLEPVAHHAVPLEVAAARLPQAHPIASAVGGGRGVFVGPARGAVARAVGAPIRVEHAKAWATGAPERVQRAAEHAAPRGSGAHVWAGHSASERSAPRAGSGVPVHLAPHTRPAGGEVRSPPHPVSSPPSRAPAHAQPRTDRSFERRAFGQPTVGPRFVANRTREMTPGRWSPVPSRARPTHPERR